MASYAPIIIKIATKHAEQKSNVRTRLPLDVTLDSATNKKTGYVKWPALVEQLQTDRVCKTKLAAAVYIRRLIDTGKLYQVPCASTGTAVCFSREPIVSDVLTTAEDERQIKNQIAQYVKELSLKTQRENRKRRNENLRRQYQKDREELMRKK
jgi:hypothetical protein